MDNRYNIIYGTNMVRFCLNSIGRKKIFWSDGYFACSIGEVSSTTIQKYIENQG